MGSVAEIPHNHVSLVPVTLFFVSCSWLLLLTNITNKNWIVLSIYFTYKTAISLRPRPCKGVYVPPDFGQVRPP